MLGRQRIQPFDYLSSLSLIGLATLTMGCLCQALQERPDSATLTARMDHEGIAFPAEALARVAAARLRHTQEFYRLEYSPDGTLLASSAGGDFQRLWDRETGKLGRRIKMPETWWGRQTS